MTRSAPVFPLSFRGGAAEPGNPTYGSVAEVPAVRFASAGTTPGRRHQMTLKARLIPCLDVKDGSSARSEARTDNPENSGRRAAAEDSVA